MSKEQRKPNLDRIREFVRKQVTAHLKLNRIPFEFTMIYNLGDTAAQHFDSVRQAILDCDFEELCASRDLDVRQDIIEIFLLTGADDEAMVIAIHSPIELYSAEMMVATKKCSKAEALVHAGDPM